MSERPPLAAPRTQTALAALDTPAALVDAARMRHNIDRMQQRMNALGVRLRPHVKTAKSLPVAQAQQAAGAQGITVSTLREAAEFFDAGFRDILYAVGMVGARAPQALALMRRGCALKLIVDNLDAARELAAFARDSGTPFEVWIEIDTDGHRSGVPPESALLLELGRALHDGGLRLGGVMTHAGASYALDTPQALAAMAEQERAGAVRAAQRLRAAGLPCAEVSVGSTPTALSARSLDGVTEVRAGVYVFQDLVMANVGICSLDELALSVLTRVIGHQSERGWVIVDAGWMAMSRDRGTQAQRHDYGYGQVCDADGRVLPGWTLTGANQEHGIMSWTDTDTQSPNAPAPDVRVLFPVGTLLRVLPNHACATAAQFDAYQVIDGAQGPDSWPRFRGW